MDGRKGQCDDQEGVSEGELLLLLLLLLLLMLLMLLLLGIAAAIASKADSREDTGNLCE